MQLHLCLRCWSSGRPAHGQVAVQHPVAGARQSASVKWRLGARKALREARHFSG